MDMDWGTVKHSTNDINLLGTTQLYSAPMVQRRRLRQGVPHKTMFGQISVSHRECAKHDRGSLWTALILAGCHTQREHAPKSASEADIHQNIVERGRQRISRGRAG
jgi:hypothetical protein